jgi:hypothetical protein
MLGRHCAPVLRKDDEAARVVAVGVFHEPLRWMRALFP